MWNNIKFKSQVNIINKFINLNNVNLKQNSYLHLLLYKNLTRQLINLVNKPLLNGQKNEE